MYDCAYMDMYGDEWEYTVLYYHYVHYAIYRVYANGTQAKK